MPRSSAQVTAAEISRLAGVTRATVSNWRRRHPDFPAPVGGTEASPAYDLAAVRDWLAARGQLPASSPADDLRTALRTADSDQSDALRLLPLVLAASRLPDAELAALSDLPDGQLGQRARKLARPHAADLPGEVEPAYRADDAGLLRALLRCVRQEGAVTAADVLAERDTEDGGTVGGYQTPVPLAELMTDLLAEPGRPFPASVFDPACGAGNLLVAAAQAGARELFGQDLVATQAAQTAVRLGILAPSATARLAAGDSLRTDAFPTLVAEGVLCAPPYGDRDWGHAELAADPRWLVGLPPRSEPELAWAQHCLAHLTPGGSAVLLLPPATAERAVGRRLRAELLRAGMVRAVLALPAGAATPLHVGLHLWLLRRPHPQVAAPQQVLFVDTAEPEPRRTTTDPTGTGGGRPALDWPALRDTIRRVWRDFTAAPDEFADVPGLARAVPVIDLLGDTVDLTPARHVRTAPAAIPPDELARTAEELRGRLRRAALDLADFSEAEAWSTVSARRTWRSAAVADLLRGNALTLLRAPTTGRGTGAGDSRPGPEIEVRAGDVLLHELLRDGTAGDRTAWVVEPDGAGQPLGRHLILLRPDPDRLDPWFLAGFLGAEENVNAAATGSTVIRLDPRRLRVPLLPLTEQRRYGQAFRRLHLLRAAADHAARLADETARTLGAGLTGGALLPPEPAHDAS